MAGRVEGKVAFITGAGRGQGRSHALRLAQEGADIIATDICSQIRSVAYPMASQADLDETATLVRETGRKIVAVRADVRDYANLRDALDCGVEELGRLDVVVANAGISSGGRMDELPEQSWQDMIDVNLTGVWHTAKAAIPHLRRAGGGSVILTSSGAGLFGMENIGHYVAAKHGVVGLMRTLALELARDSIRVNSIHPGNVDTPMIQNSATYALFAPDLSEAERTRERLSERFAATHALDVPWIQPADVSALVLFLASEDARYLTGATLPIDAGAAVK